MYEYINEIKITGLNRTPTGKTRAGITALTQSRQKSVGKRSRDSFDGGRDRPGHMLRKISVALGAVAEVSFSILTVT